VTDPRDIEQPEPRRADSRGFPLAERPRSWLVGPLVDGVPMAVEAAPTAPLSIIDALEVEIADAHMASEWDRMSRPPRSERRG